MRQCHVDEVLALELLASQALRWAGEQELMRKTLEWDDAPTFPDQECDDVRVGGNPGDCIAPAFQQCDFAFKGHLPLQSLTEVLSAADSAPPVIDGHSLRVAQVVAPPKALFAGMHQVWWLCT